MKLFSLTGFIIQKRFDRSFDSNCPNCGKRNGFSVHFKSNSCSIKCVTCNWTEYFIRITKREDLFL